MQTESSLPRSRWQAWLRDNWRRVLAHAAGLFTLTWLALDYASQTDIFTFNRTVMLRTGSAGLMLLVASFACTPVSRLFGWQRLIQVRRALGLYGFLYSVLHVWNYAVWESGLDVALIARDLEERRAMSIGLLALLALIPLALTSTRGWQRRLGRRWRTLHRLIYVAMPLSVLHYLWLERDIITTPVVYAVVIGGLFVLRLPAVRHALRRLITGQR
ncbi:MAG TPA: protein-methionine-sulfoxide reductase heme-binding subunit MsrQ [Anaerolineae bacterium]|nr:protein-methionine-sulfoxide reductase heme-binding subunit MsrQ [Anaerolineae bacterium]